MEVICERCKAEYELDSVLASSKGTTVRCTNCGLQFVVTAPPGAAGPERWLVWSSSSGTAVEYSTVEELRVAIESGLVVGTDRLARGDEVPRPLSEILELAPLLRQRASYRPPEVQSERPPPAGTKGRTRLGFPSLADLPPGAHFTPPPAPQLERPSSRPPQAPRVRSALSGPYPPVKEGPPSSGRSGQSAMAPDWAPSLPAGATGGSSLRMPVADARPRPRTQGVAASSQGPASASTPGLRPGRARGAWLGFVVVLSALGFGLTVGRDRIRQVFGQSSAEVAPADASSSAAPESQLHTHLVRADVAWWRIRLLPANDARRVEVEDALNQELQKAAQMFGKVPPAARERLVSAQVDFYRMSGRIARARQALAGPASESVRSYTVAVLDLAEATKEPPYALIIRHLDMARGTDEAPYLARTAQIVALAESGDLALARAQHEELKALPSGQDTLLMADLSRFMDRAVARSTVPLEEAPEASPTPPEEPKAPSAPEPEAPAAAAETQPARAAKPAEPKQEPEVTAEVQSWVSQADALWGVGDQAQAVTYYKKVVSALGRRHFLGQRAAARIRQAQKESGSSKP